LHRTECRNYAKQREGNSGRQQSETFPSGARYNSLLVVLHVLARAQAKKSSK